MHCYFRALPTQINLREIENTGESTSELKGRTHLTYWSVFFRTSVWLHQPLTLNPQMWSQLCCFEGHALPCIWQHIWNQRSEATEHSKSICNDSTVLHRFILFFLKHALLPLSSAKARGGYIKNTKIFPACPCFKGEKKDMEKFGMTENKYKLIPYFFASEPWWKPSAPSISWPLSPNDRTPTKIFYKNWIRGWNNNSGADSNKNLTSSILERSAGLRNKAQKFL